MQEKSKKKTPKVKKTEKYIEGVGRRKTATARVRIFPLKKSSAKEEKLLFSVNSKDAAEYFHGSLEAMQKITSPLRETKTLYLLKISVRVRGGGITGQIEAIRHGLARALAKYDPELIPTLAARGFLTRDSRVVERKKYGLKKARRAAQWQKR